MLSLSTFQHKFPIILPLHPPQKKGICFATSLKTSHFWCVFGIITILSPKGTGSVRLLSVGILTGAGDCMTSGTALGFESTLEGNTSGQPCTMSSFLLPVPFVPKLKKTSDERRQGADKWDPPWHPPSLQKGSSCQVSPWPQSTTEREGGCHHTTVQMRTVRDLPKVHRQLGAAPRSPGLGPWALFLIPHSHNVSDFLWYKDPIAARILIVLNLLHPHSFHSWVLLYSPTVSC